MRVHNFIEASLAALLFALTLFVTIPALLWAVSR
jgi:hypothetical protein